MKHYRNLKSVALAGVSVIALTSAAAAENFNIPAGTLENALNAYTEQSGQQLLYPNALVKGLRTHGAAGEMTAEVALSRILTGTGLATRQEADATVIVSQPKKTSETVEPATRLAEAATPAHAAAAVETVVVTSSKIKGDIQTVPIAITALSQEQLTSRQIAGGPDLVKEVPNLTFSKTNFTGYNIEIRGIGTQAISVTTDPAVAVAFNDIPFLRNHFFEQEFYDVSQVEVLRGPQGTLYGRNATAGVVNVISAKPTDQFEAMGSVDIGNYNNHRFEGMINIPVVDDRLDLRAAGEWTKRDGYSFNEITSAPIDGRDLWSTRISVGFRPTTSLQAYLIWEHFQESDDRLRSSKQLCKTDLGPSAVNGVPVPPVTDYAFGATGAYLSQGCSPVSLYSPDAFEVPNGYSLPYILALDEASQVNAQDPYFSGTQSRNLRVIESALDPKYRAKNDTAEFNAEYNLTPALSVSSQTGFDRDFLYSTEDYNRFNTSPEMWSAKANNGIRANLIEPNGDFCDPQLGCSSRLIGEDLSTERAWQLSQEFRLASNFTGPLNFSVGGNYMHYETDENYYVFINALTLIAATPAFTPANFSAWVPNVSDNLDFLNGTERPDPFAGSNLLLPMSYIDPNPLSSINGQGHNYFRSDNPYVLNSYAGFGEVYYNILPDLKLIGGLRWTEDKKHFIRIPSEILIGGYGYPSLGTLDQQWDKLTGRLAANWTPKLDFTDQTLVYASYAHGYKAGGANPPGAILISRGGVANPIHPLTFEPEFIDAYELGSKNTMLDGALTLNGDAFFYNYKGYQISEIVDRTAINLNFDATVKGAELEATWEATPGLKFSFAGGYESTRVANGSKAVDLMDRTDAAHHPDWLVVKPFATQASNCVLPSYVVQYVIGGLDQYAQISFLCGRAYANHVDPLTVAPYTPDPTVDQFGNPLPYNFAGYTGFDPLAGTPGDPYTGQNIHNGHDYGPVPNNGAGFDKDLSGNQLPNAPHFTASLTAEYTIPVSEDWAATLHSDFYWQSQSFARIFNDVPYDKIRGYSNVNLALILTGADGWQVLGYLKNVFDTTAITGDFLNSDDSGLTTNVFLTDPRLYGVRVTKNF